VRREFYARYWPWQRGQIRGINSGVILDFVHTVHGFMELHGDRAFGDDKASSRAGEFTGRPVAVVVTEEARTRNKRDCNLANRSRGYEGVARDALARSTIARCWTFIDTPARTRELTRRKRAR